MTYFDTDKREHFQRARAVVVCANGAETARLLLMSANAKFPDGLANSSGLVGKNLMFNTYAEVHAIFEHELNEFKSVQVTRIVHDWYEHDPKRGFYGGGGLDGRIGPMPIAWSLFAPPPDRTWGASFKSLLEALPRAMIVASHATSLPMLTNTIDLDPELKDAWGLPALRMTYKDHPDDLAMSRFLQDRAVDIMQAAGAAGSLERPGRGILGLPAPARHGAHGERPEEFGRRQVSPHARHPEPVRLRRLELRDLGARPADHDDPGTRVPGRRPHRAVCQARRDLTRYAARMPSSRRAMIASASPMMRSTSSWQLGTSRMSPATMPHDHAPASISPFCMTLG